MKYIIGFITAALLFAAAPRQAAAMNCYGVAYYTDRGRAIIFRAQRSVTSEKEGWVQILFEDFAGLERTYKSIYQYHRLRKDQRFKGKSGPTNFQILCFEGNPDHRVIKWPRATFPVLPNERVAASIMGILGFTSTWRQETGGWVATETRGPTFWGKYQVCYQKRDGEDLGPKECITQERGGIVGPQSYARSQIEASVHHAVMRATRGKFHIVSEGGDAWESGKPKPSRPLSFDGTW